MRLEYKRKAVHIIFGLLFVVLLNYDIINEYIIFMFFCLTVSIFIINSKKKFGVFEKILNHCEREKNRHSSPGKGSILFIAGVLLAVVLFNRNAALASIMILTLGDAIGPMIGHFGKIKHPFHSNRYFEGLLAGIMVGFLGALLFVSWWQALVASVIAMFAESIDEIRGMRIDDNLVIPIVAGIVLTLLGV